MLIGIDLMGSDRSPQVLFDAVIQAAKQFDSSVTFVVFTTQEAVDALSDLQKQVTGSFSIARIKFELVQDVITMRDEPVQSIRQKKNSSLVQGIRLLKKKGLDAFVTAGNTGALIACATLTLPLLPGIRRPALLATLPTEEGQVAVLDVGGNVLCKAAHFVHFAELGAAFQRIHFGLAAPRIGLLNIGNESKKGTLEHRQAYQLLQTLSNNKPHLQFIGNIEGREVFQDKVDVLVTDGFTGNVLLKTSEGVAFFILDFLRRSLATSPVSQVQHILQQLQAHFSYTEYPGAILLGVDGVVVKCHGDSSSKAMYNSIKAAATYVEQQLIVKLKAELTSLI